MNIRRALSTAHEILREQHDPSDLPLLEAGLSSGIHRSIRNTALSAIWAWAREGDSRAISVLQSAAKSSKYSDVKVTAEYYLESLGLKE